MTDRLTPQREAEIAARAEAAHPGPWCTDSWEIYQGTEYVPGISYWIGETCRADEDNDGRSDAAFVAHARTDVPALLAELAAVRAERDEQRERALDALNRSVEDGREVCADCGRPVPDGPCGVHSPDAVFQRACQEAAQLRAERDKARAALRDSADQIAELESDLAGAITVSAALNRRLAEEQVAGSGLYAALTMPTTPEQRQAALDKFTAVAQQVFGSEATR